MATSKWGECKDCKWFQIEPGEKAKRRTEARDESLESLLESAAQFMKTFDDSRTAQTDDGGGDQSMTVRSKVKTEDCPPAVVYTPAEIAISFSWALHESREERWEQAHKEQRAFYLRIGYARAQNKTSFMQRHFHFPSAHK